MKLSLIALSLIALSGCAKPVPVKQPEPTPIVVRPAPPPAPTSLEVNRTEWKVTLPLGWIVKPTGPKKPGTTNVELMAMSSDNVGDATIGVSIATVPLADMDDPSDEEFPGAAVVHADCFCRSPPLFAR